MSDVLSVYKKRLNNVPLQSEELTILSFLQKSEILNTKVEERFANTSMLERDGCETLWSEPEETLQQLGLRKGMSVLDLGCGYGHFTIPAARLVNPATVIGMDTDLPLLEEGYQAGEGITNCSWIWGDIRNLSKLVNNEFDYVLLMSAFHGVPDQVELVRNVASVLKPGGYFCVVNWCPIPGEATLWLGKPRGAKTEARMSPEQVISLVQRVDVGLSFERQVKLPPYHYGVIFRRSTNCD
jgi:SAM-dependent methyltransferase